MVSQATAQDTPQAKHYDPETGTWDGQTPFAGMPSQEPPQEPDKTGGHHDRQTWANQFMPTIGHGTFKALTLLAEYANPKGECWPSMDLLRYRSGMSERALRRAFSEMRSRGIAGARNPGLAVWMGNPYQLAGGLNGWTCDESGTQPMTKVAHRTLPFSSNPELNPEPVVGCNEKGPEPATVGARFDETGGRKRKDPEGIRRASPLAPEPSMTGEPTDSAPPPLPAARPELNYHPDRPPAAWMPGYVQTMLRRYRKTWLVEWDMEEEKVIRWYSKHWDKFLVDLQRHRANELANVGYAADLRALGELDAMQPEAPAELVHCEKCGAETSRPKGPVMMIAGERVSDACFDCTH